MTLTARKEWEDEDKLELETVEKLNEEGDELNWEEKRTNQHKWNDLELCKIHPT